MRPTKVLIIVREFFSSSFPIGGAERQALQLARELQKSGISVRIVTGQWDWGQPAREIIQGISVHRNFTAWGMFHIRGIRKYGYYCYLISLFVYLLYHQHEFDVIHCHSANSEAAVGVFAGQLSNKPVMIRPMASGAYRDLKKLYKDLSLGGKEWVLHKLGQADAVVALNQQVVDEMKELGVESDRFFFIPNGVEIKSTTHQRNYAQHEPMRIVFVGRLHPQKDLATLLRALGRLKRGSPNLAWRLQLAGTGPSQPVLKALADELGITKCIEFLGYIENIDNLLEQSDCFILPSVSEGMSNALLEAMAQGLPCIATDIPGNNDLLNHQHNGLLVPPNDDQALAEAIVNLLTDESLRQALGQEALKTVQENYSLPSVAKRYASLYAALLKSNQE